MADLTPIVSWSAVLQLETNTPALGGAGGVMNAQAQALLNRTEWLNENKLGKDGPQAIDANSTSPTLRITQRGIGHAFVVEDQASDTTPFVIDQSGRINKGGTTWFAAFGSFVPETQLVGNASQSSLLLNSWQSGSNVPSRLCFARGDSNTPGDFSDAVDNNDTLGAVEFAGSDGAKFVQAARIDVSVDGTGAGLDSMPGRIIFSTTPVGGSAPVEAMRINSAQSLSLGPTAAQAGTNFRISKALTGNATAYGIVQNGVIQPDVVTVYGVLGTLGSAANAGAPYTIANIYHYGASQGTYNADSTVTNQFGFSALSSLTGAANNYGFHSNLATATGRWNFFANGTAPNWFAGDVRSGTVITEYVLPASVNADATLTASQLRNHIVDSTPTGNITLTLPTGANLDAAFQQLQNGQGFEWSVINLAAATHTVTVAANTAHSVVGNMVVQPGTSGRFLSRKTASNTFQTLRIA